MHSITAILQMSIGEGGGAVKRHAGDTRRAAHTCPLPADPLPPHRQTYYAGYSCNRIPTQLPATARSGDRKQHDSSASAALSPLLAAWCGEGPQPTHASWYTKAPSTSSHCSPTRRWDSRVPMAHMPHMAVLASAYVRRYRARRGGRGCCTTYNL